MPDYAIFLQVNVPVLGSTRMVYLPHTKNPVTAVDTDSAIKAAATELANTFGEEKAMGVYVAVPFGSISQKKVVNFDRTALFG